jgi:hypothetical protein
MTASEGLGGGDRLCVNCRYGPISPYCIRDVPTAKQANLGVGAGEALEGFIQNRDDPLFVQFRERDWKCPLTMHPDLLHRIMLELVIVFVRPHLGLLASKLGG